MIILNKKILTFNIKEVHLSDHPFDINNCDYLKFHYCKKKTDIKGFTRKKELTSIIDLTQDLETIWQNMDRKQTRYGIRKAEREGIKVRISNDYQQFLQMYKSFIQKKGIKPLFNTFGVGNIPLDNMKKYGTLFLAELDGKILSANLYLENQNAIEAWICASKRLEAKDKKEKTLIASATRLIDWEAMKYANNNGLKEFNFGGHWPKEEAEKDARKKGINSFKLSFGGKTVTRYYYEKIYSKSFRLIHHLYSSINKI
ncbi:MAG TPA: peptidoglycan bridge formation glycyltransferase FemA/FemB family protein [Thermoplasmatales archaeon]|nr:peptidoglycan bridge formation glycyltransferase FemA/FemB family protein [Thermoplasmatales archaeon]